jgi:glycosyltransferase involved in cell wall biosynthesis
MKHYAEWLSARGVSCVHIPIGAYHKPELLPENSEQEILFFTTLAPYKGLEILLTAFESLKTEFPKLRLTIAGTNHARFPEYAKDLKLKFNGTHNIHWLEEISEERVIELFQRAQVVALPYTASTGSSSVLTQAATWGRAVVASDLIEHQNTASESNLRIEFFKSGDQHSLQNALRTLLFSAEARAAQTKHNFASIQRAHPSVTSQHYIYAFNRALEQRKSQKRIESALNETDPT